MFRRFVSFQPFQDWMSSTKGKLLLTIGQISEKSTNDKQIIVYFSAAWWTLPHLCVFLPTFSFQREWLMNIVSIRNRLQQQKNRSKSNSEDYDILVYHQFKASPLYWLCFSSKPFQQSKNENYLQKFFCLWIHIRTSKKKREEKFAFVCSILLCSCMWLQNR